MTMRLTIKNDDTARTATIVVEERTADDHTWRQRNSFTLRPQGVQSVHIHAASRVQIIEDPHATQPRQPEPEKER